MIKHLAMVEIKPKLGNWWILISTTQFHTSVSSGENHHQTSVDMLASFSLISGWLSEFGYLTFPK